MLKPSAEDVQAFETTMREVDREGDIIRNVLLTIVARATAEGNQALINDCEKLRHAVMAYLNGMAKLADIATVIN